MVLVKKPTALGTTTQRSASPMEEGPRKNGGHGTRQKHARVLIVDDEIQLANGLAMILGRMNCESVISDGKDALEKFKNGAFGLVITDMNMPYICGTELTRRILEIDPNARVIIHTANDSMTFDELTATGACDVLRKPAPVGEIKEIVERNLIW
jgi:DNA-binding NtrC family response regulator